MPQYLAPGVYVEEIPGPETIQAVGTQTAGFIGPCRFGPTSGRPELLTSFLDFQRIYGDWTDLEFTDNGDIAQLHGAGSEGLLRRRRDLLLRVPHLQLHRPHLRPRLTTTPRPRCPTSSPSSPQLTLRARFPGTAGQMAVTLTLQVGRNALVISTSPPAYNLTRVHGTTWSTPTRGRLRRARCTWCRRTPTGAWTFGDNPGLPLSSATFAYPVSVAVAVQFPSVDAQGLPTLGPSQTVGVFGFDPRAAGTGISTVLTPNPPNRAQWLSVPVALEGTGGS